MEVDITMVALCHPQRFFVKTSNEFSIKVSDNCEKKYHKISKRDNNLRNTVEKILEDLKYNPYLGQKLHVNFNGCRSIHFLKNKYRIVYQIYEDKGEILILEIGHRKNSYSDLAKVLGSGV